MNYSLSELFTPEKPFEREFLQAIFTKIIDAIEAIRKQSACLIIVSNEVIQDLIFHDEFLKSVWRDAGNASSRDRRASRCCIYGGMGSAGEESY